MSGSSNERFRRVKRLALTGGPEVLAPLTKALHDPNVHIQVEAVRGLGNAGSVEVVPALLKYVRICDPVAFEPVARALVDLGLREAPEELADLLSDPDYTRRYAAAICLGAVGDATVEVALTEATRDEIGMVRRGACRALGELGDRRAALALAIATGDPDSLVRRAAAKALAKVNAGGEALQRISRDPDWKVRRTALETLAEVAGRAAVPTLEEALGDYESRVRERASELLAGLGAVEPVIEVLAGDLRPDVRRTAAEALGRSGDARAAYPLLDSLAREGVVLRGFVLKALRQILSSGLEDFLAEALSAQEVRIRVASTNALVEFGARSKTPVIAELLEDPDPRVRFAAVGALGELRASEGLVPLHRFVVGEDAGMRSAAAHALSRMPGTKPILEEAARHTSLAVREVAQAALISREAIGGA